MLVFSVFLDFYMEGYFLTTWDLSIRIWTLLCLFYTCLFQVLLNRLKSFTVFFAISILFWYNAKQWWDLRTKILAICKVVVLYNRNETCQYF